MKKGWYVNIFVLILLLAVSCSTNSVDKALENLLGHWVSEDGKFNLYFSDNFISVVEEQGTTMHGAFTIGVVEGPDSYKFKDKFRLKYRTGIYKSDTIRECWLTFIKKGKVIEVDLWNENTPTKWYYVDKNQQPE